MFLKDRKILSKFSALLMVIVIVLSLSGLAAAPARAQSAAINYSSCTTLYAVQPGDTLYSIAARFGTNANNLLDLNDLQYASQIFPGLVICISQAGGVILPPTGGESAQPGLRVVSVRAGQNVTVEGVDFPAGVYYVAQMLNYRASDAQIIQAGGITIPQGGSFQQTFDIPQGLKNVERLRIRLASSRGPAASAVFNNTGDQTMLESCSQYYTVRSGDTLSQIAASFGVSLSDLLELNTIADRSVIFPGQRLCIRGETVTLPNTGANPSLEVVDVDPGDDVTLRGLGFTPNEQVIVSMNRMNGPISSFAQVDTFVVPENGRFLRTFTIPQAVANENNLTIRFTSRTSELAVMVSFANRAQSGTGGTGGTNQETFPVTAAIELPNRPAATRTAPISPGQEITVAQGNAGVYLPSSSLPNANLTISRYDASIGAAKGLNFVQQLLLVQATSNNQDLSNVRGLVYVFFGIDQQTRQQYGVRQLDIYQYDPAAQAWKQCDVQVPVNDDGQVDRLACIVNQLGLFGLAVQP